MPTHTATFPNSLLDTALNKGKTHMEVPPEGEKQEFLSLTSKHVGPLPVCVTSRLSKVQAAEALGVTKP